MASIQGVKSPNEEAVDMWSSLFVQGVASTNQSATFVKQLVVVSLSAVTYLRAFFPEAAYREQIINTNTHKILTQSPFAPDATLFLHQLSGCFEAIDKKYLKELCLVVYKDDINQPLETYTHKFSYNREGTPNLAHFTLSHGVGLGRRLRYPTMQLLSTLGHFLHQHNPQHIHHSSNDVLLGLKLKYYDEVTPDEYDPPGFMPVRETEPIFPFPVVKIKVGKVSTGFHQVRLDVVTDKHYTTASVASCHISNQEVKEEMIDIKEEPVLPEEERPLQTERERIKWQKTRHNENRKENAVLPDEKETRKGSTGREAKSGGPTNVNKQERGIIERDKTGGMEDGERLRDCVEIFDSQSGNYTQQQQQISRQRSQSGNDTQQQQQQQQTSRQRRRSYKDNRKVG
ncbi:hypothetical protein Pmani_029932 [Petrolisthes manimaculis]|uniref:HORMA domain-containing protein n=1 Tax=Petrolisthes manimaculis TaxID=1843537 RepID=A0AAE1NWP4_9EUCA|nr:hypothetical protein Pmani_029932 [Petrolisthes manimaculis]